MPKAGWKSKRVKSWPDGHRECNKCKILKPLDAFGIFKNGARGRYPICNECRRPIAKQKYKEERLTYRLYYRAKRRAKVRGLEFSITEEDIKIPDLCPVFKVKMKGNYVASLDRIDSSKGYTKDNIQVISNRANVLKNNASIEELKQLLNYCEIVNIGDAE